jgi:hypothetical protein
MSETHFTFLHTCNYHMYVHVYSKDKTWVHWLDTVHCMDKGVLRTSLFKCKTQDKPIETAFQGLVKLKQLGFVCTFGIDAMIMYLIFVNYLWKYCRFNLKTIVVIDVLKQTNSNLSQKRQFYRHIFRRKCFKNHTIGPRYQKVSEHFPNKAQNV